MSPWQRHVARWKDCKQCPLGGQRDRIVLARGTLPCNILFVGEAPGMSEDALGQPFVGPAGHLLDRIIGQAINPPVTHALTNLVACYPRDAKNEGINEPEYHEIIACRERLVEFVNIAQPNLIVRVGRLATGYVPVRDGMRYIDVDHPAAILRMPLAQQQMAARRCVVQVRNAVEQAIQSPKQFVKWEVDRAKVKTHRLVNDDDGIPF